VVLTSLRFNDRGKEGKGRNGDPLKEGGYLSAIFETGEREGRTSSSTQKNHNVRKGLPAFPADLAEGKAKEGGGEEPSTSGMIRKREVWKLPIH